MLQKKKHNGYYVNEHFSLREVKAKERAARMLGKYNRKVYQFYREMYILQRKSLNINILAYMRIEHTKRLRVVTY